VSVVIFLSIIAFCFGMTIVSLGLIFQDKIGPIPAGLIAAAVAFIGSTRVAHNRRQPGQLVVVAVATLIPVWVVPFFAGSAWQFQRFVVPMIITSVATVGGLVFTYLRERDTRVATAGKPR
jgi:hypothetical protein